MSRLQKRLFRSLIFTSACMFLYISTAGTTIAAATDPITIISQTDTITFPKSIDFQISVHDNSSTVKHATLYLSYNSTGYTEQHDIDINGPQSTNLVNWHEDTSNNYSPVGTVIGYYWRIVDSAGNVNNERPQNFTITDTRFHWQHLTQGFLQVNWYDRPITFGQTVLDQAEKDITHIQANLGGGLNQPTNIWVYEKALDFHNALPPQAHEWVGGIAFPNLNQASIVVYDSNDDTLTRDMPHEITHLVFHQISGASNSAPLWFDEGLAVYNQFYHEPEMTQRFKQALSIHTLIRLNAIENTFPTDANKAYLAYAQSWQMLNYMYNTFGRSRMATLIRDLNNKGIAWDSDLTKDIGINQEHLENQWRLSLNQSAILNAGKQSIAVQKQLTIKQEPAPMINDPLAPLLFTIGLLMIVLPIFGFGGLLLHRHSNHRQEAVKQQIEQVLQSSTSHATRSPNRTIGDYSNMGRYHAGSNSARPELPDTPPHTTASEYPSFLEAPLQDDYREQYRDNQFFKWQTPQE